jgi:hypothetical protein
MTQRNQRLGERAKAELLRRETLYGEFITETAHLTADAFDHSLDRPETVARVYALLGRIRLIASVDVITAAEECCQYVVEMYSKPNLTTDQICDWLRAAKHPLTNFAAACRVELNQFMG